MCPECNGLGTRMEFDPQRFVEPDKSLLEGGMRAWGPLGKKQKSGTYKLAQQIVEQFGQDLTTPWGQLSEECRNAILYGGTQYTWKWDNKNSTGQIQGQFEGVFHATLWRYKQNHSEWSRQWYINFMSQQPCPTCHGQRLRPESAAVTIGGKTMTEVTALNIGESLGWVESLWPHLNPEQMQIAEEVLKEINERLQFLVNVGLHYLSLDRPAPSLSGGEGQRIRLASQIGCGLVGVLYVLDEPSIGLHSRDNRRLLDTLERLRDLGNTVVVVEHDEETMRTADWIVDLGPEGGDAGGNIVAEGTPEEVVQQQESYTGQFLKKLL
jgi:excinuclease ABC subunit A